MSLLIICLQLLLFVPNTPAHDFYYGHCTIDYYTDSQSIGVSLNLDIENLEEVLEAQGTGRLFLGEKNEAPLVEEYLNRYLHDHFNLEVNGKPAAFEYLGKDPKIDVLWCFLEVTDVPSLSSLKVENTLLFDRFDIQTHILKVRAHGKEFNVMLNRDKPSERFEF